MTVTNPHIKHVDPGKYLDYAEYYSDTGHTVDYALVRTADYVIAATDSSNYAKSQADAVCDGVQDEVEIKAGITIAASYGASVYLAAGGYAISEAMAMADLDTSPASVKVFGAGKGTILTAGGDFYIFDVNGPDDMVFEDLSFVAAGSGTADAAILVRSTSTGVVIRRCWANGFYRCFYGHTATDLMIQDCHTTGGIYTGISFYRCIKSKVLNHYSDGDSTDGTSYSIEITDGGSSYGYNLVQGCVATSATGWGIGINDGYYSQAIANYVDVSATTAGCLELLDCVYCKAIGNTLVGSIAKANQYGISISGEHVTCDNNTVTGNHLLNHDRPIWLVAANYNMVADNQIDAYEVSANTYNGITLYNDTTYNTIRGNTIKGAGYGGIRLRGTSDGDCNYNIVIGNTVYDGDTTMAFGITEYTSYCDYNYIGHNNVRGVTTGVVVGGAHTVAEGNQGYIARGEIRQYSGTLAGVTPAGIMLSVDNPFGQAVRVLDVDIDITTQGAGSGTMCVGVGSSATTDYATIFSVLPCDPGTTYPYFYRATKTATYGVLTSPINWATGSGNRYLNFYAHAANNALVATYTVTVMGV